MRLCAESAVSASIAGQSTEKVVWTQGVGELRALLALDCGRREIAIEKTGSQLVADDGLPGGRAHNPLLPARMRGVPDCPRRDFRLVDGTDGLGLPSTWLLTQSNWGVLTPGSCTIVSVTLLPA